MLLRESDDVSETIVLIDRLVSARKLGSMSNWR